MMNDEELGNLTQRICKTLPQELRDKVYGHIWDEETVNLYFKSSQMSSGVAKNPRPPRFLDRDVVGQQFAKEALEGLFWEARTFEVGDVRFSRKFLYAENYGLGIRAIDCQLRGVTFVQPLVQDAFEHVRSSFEENLRPLFRMDLRPGFVLTIKVECYPRNLYDPECHIWHLRKLVTCSLKGHIKELEAKQVKVIIKYIKGARNPDFLEVDISEMIHATPEGWLLFLGSLWRDQV
jgi:hypothetical protein